MSDWWHSDHALGLAREALGSGAFSRNMRRASARSRGGPPSPSRGARAVGACPRGVSAGYHRGMPEACSSQRCDTPDRR